MNISQVAILENLIVITNFPMVNKQIKESVDGMFVEYWVFGGWH